MTICYNFGSQWPADKIKYLKKMWPTHSSKEIAFRLDVSRDAVAAKAVRLGLGPKPKRKANVR